MAARERDQDVKRDLDDVRKQQDRLLNLHLTHTIDETAFGVKSVELRDRMATLRLQLEATDRRSDEKADLALKVFELSQSLHAKWLTADFPEKRQILDLVCLNLMLEGTSLSIAKRKPFNMLVEGLVVSDSGEGETRLELWLSEAACLADRGFI